MTVCFCRGRVADDEGRLSLCCGECGLERLEIPPCQTLDEENGLRGLVGGSSGGAGLDKQWRWRDSELLDVGHCSFLVDAGREIVELAVVVGAYPLEEHLASYLSRESRDRIAKGIGFPSDDVDLGSILDGGSGHAGEGGNGGVRCESLFGLWMGAPDEGRGLMKLVLQGRRVTGTCLRAAQLAASWMIIAPKPG